MGASGVVDGVTYTKRDAPVLRSNNRPGEVATTCTTGITDMREMFGSSFNEDVSSWDTTNVTNMRSMFLEATAFNQDISSWDTTNVTNMYGMFYNAKDFNQDLSGWCVSKISSKPKSFDALASSWTKPRPIWGTCP